MGFLCQIYRKYSIEVGRILKEGPELPFPIVWRVPVQTENPSASFTKTLQETDKRRLEFIQKEVELFSHLLPSFPEKMQDEAWNFLLSCKSRKERLDHLIFLRRKEKLREKDKQKKIQRQLAERESIQWKTYINWNISKTERLEKQLASTKIVTAHLLKDRPSLAVDCQFFEKMSPRAAQLTAAQLKYLDSENRAKRNPWPLYFVNFDENSPSNESVLKRHLGLLLSKEGSSCSPIATPLSYTALFPKEKIIYLSPHAEEELIDFKEEDVIYVMGGIVDRIPEKGIHPQASRIEAEENGVRCLKLPLDRYIKWKSGSKLLTLVAVANILHDVHETNGDWSYALSRNIPVRNIRGTEEKNKNVRDLHNKYREFNNQIIRIVNEKLPEL